MKPLLGRLTLDDALIWEHWVGRREHPDWWWRLRDFSTESDRRDAELMLGLTGPAPGAAGICVAYLWLIGCVIHNGTTGRAVALRGFEADYGPDRHDITYFA